MSRAALAALALAAAAFVAHLALRPPKRSTDDAIRGIALGLFAADATYDYRAMLDEIAARGATDVLLVVPWYQRDLAAHDLAPRPGHSPADEAIARTLRAARARGLRPALMPIVRLIRRAPGDWRGRLRPADVDAWFAAYGAFVARMATLAEAGGAVRLYVGSELGALEPHADRWRRVIADARDRFRGRLSYAVNWDRLDGVAFWDALDEIGVSAYFPMPSPADPAAFDAALDAAWTEPRRRLAALAAAHRRPLVLTEVGYPSRPSAAARPWDDGGPAPVDLDLQARLVAGFCRAWAPAALADGFYAWNWFGIGGPRDPGFSLRGKPAAARFGRCLRGWVMASR